MQTFAQLHSIHFTNFKKQMAKPKPVCWQIIHVHLDKKQISEFIGKSQKNTRYGLFASTKKKPILTFITTLCQNVATVIYFLLGSMRTQGNTILY